MWKYNLVKGWARIEIGKKDGPYQFHLCLCISVINVLARKNIGAQSQSSIIKSGVMAVALIVGK